MTDPWAIALAIVYFIGYAGQASATMRDPDEGPRYGRWALVTAIFWPLAALGEILTPMED